MSLHVTYNSIRAGTVDNNNSGNSIPVTRQSTQPPTPPNMSTHPGSAHLNPADDDTPVSNSHEAKATASAEAISKVLRTNNSSKPKLWEPDPFDSSDSHKLHTFILQCKLNFQDRKDPFEDNTN